MCRCAFVYCSASFLFYKVIVFGVHQDYTSVTISKENSPYPQHRRLWWNVRLFACHRQRNQWFVRRSKMVLLKLNACYLPITGIQTRNPCKTGKILVKLVRKNEGQLNCMLYLKSLVVLKLINGYRMKDRSSQNAA